jgi:hypothetical protein
MSTKWTLPPPHFGGLWHICLAAINVKLLVTTPVDRLKAFRDKSCGITQSQKGLDMLTGDGVMDDRYCPSAFSLNT